MPVKGTSAAKICCTRIRAKPLPPPAAGRWPRATHAQSFATRGRPGRARACARAWTMSYTLLPRFRLRSRDSASSPNLSTRTGVSIYTYIYSYIYSRTAIYCRNRGQRPLAEPSDPRPGSGARGESTSRVSAQQPLPRLGSDPRTSRAKEKISAARNFGAKCGATFPRQGAPLPSIQLTGPSPGQSAANVAATAAGAQYS